LKLNNMLKNILMILILYMN